MALTPTTLDLTNANGQVLSANQFSSVVVSADSTDIDVGVAVPGRDTWATETGGAWTEGSGASLTYTVTGVNNPFQVVTIVVTGGPEPVTIFGQVVAYNSDTFVMNGFESFDPSTGALSNPLTAEGGSTATFLMSDESLLHSGFPTDVAFFAGSGEDQGAFRTTLESPSCFAEGTLVATPAGPVAVELLAVGDLVRVYGGRSQAVRWIGQRDVRCEGARQPARVCPVQVKAGAFGAGLPQRDLFLSPEHAVFQEGVLVPIHRLVNGTTIRQVPVPSVTYYHVALAGHGILFAEGLPAESYLDTGSGFGVGIGMAA
jgi:hypothetical protein